MERQNVKERENKGEKEREGERKKEKKEEKKQRKERVIMTNKLLIDYFIPMHHKSTNIANSFRFYIISTKHFSLPGVI